jgi:hypothetical protein
MQAWIHASKNSQFPVHSTFVAAKRSEQKPGSLLKPGFSRSPLQTIYIALKSPDKLDQPVSFLSAIWDITD